MISISNDFLTATFSQKGAELQSLRRTADGHEYLWHGDAAFWGGHSPILFPATGRPWNETVRLAGEAWHMPKHGLVRARQWQVEAAGANEVTFVCTSTVADFALFPFSWQLRVTYRLVDRTLQAHMAVTNTGGTTLWFQAGGHPAIATDPWNEADGCGGYIGLEGQAAYFRLVGEQGCWLPEEHAVPTDADGLMPITPHTFDADALIFPEGQVQAVTVYNRARCAVARVASSAPVWLLWAPAGKCCPFVCAEPWYGLCDAVGFEGELPQRPYIQHAEAGETWHGGYEIACL